MMQLPAPAGHQHTAGKLRNVAAFQYWQAQDPQWRNKKQKKHTLHRLHT
jgi:hypothetical protein